MTADTKDDDWGFGNGTATQLGEISQAAWIGSTHRWVMAQVGNQGALPAHMTRLGVGTKKDVYTVASTGIACGKTQSYMRREICDEDIPPGETRIVAVQLTDTILGQLEEDRRALGLQICIRVDPYGVQCGIESHVQYPAALSLTGGK
ncbi:hypothetical protein JWS13_39035 [Rhodococcus pseudokoreensis]|uniref:Uncharacterized protein n=1 Tax=Rhodococcus pseudokoreensis TaxID=2811421 RepID=A0A974WCG4_9NOCA|nr:hypothetical protein [Rhodococcus pseudokoreensis]QSE94173.1 hypothetical protein JWS13_39035 [Rhodococcus pseudokoreensis]